MLELTNIEVKYGDMQVLGAKCQYKEGEIALIGPRGQETTLLTHQDWFGLLPER